MTPREGANGHDPADAGTSAGSDPDTATAAIPEPTLAEVIDDLADEFPDIERMDGAEGIDYAVGPQLFSRLRGTVAEFRLRPEIVAAGTKTGDASESALGREWIAFGPKLVDQYALDRAQAWFELAHRLAAESSARPNRRH